MKELVEHNDEIARLCRELGVERLDVFGSATRPDFGATSDIDVIVRFDRRQGQMFNRYFELKERLEFIFHRPVDVMLEDSIRNPYLRETVERSRVVLYES